MRTDRDELRTAAPRLRGWRRFAAVGLAAAVSFPGAASGEPGSTGATQGSTWQGGPLHDGHAPDAVMAPPLTVAWQAQLPRASHAVVGDGRAFVMSVEPDGSYGSVVHALDVATGNSLWSVSLGGTYFWGGHTYADGRLITVNGDGGVRALDARTGETLWSAQLSQYAFSSPPTAAFGAVYIAGAGSGHTLYALDAATGQELWATSDGGGDHSSPVVTEDSVYVANACGVALSFRRSDGELQWQRTTGCSGGGGRTAVLHEDRLYVRDYLQYGAVLDARTGAELAPLDVTVAPAFHEGTGFFVEEGRLVARHAATGARLWSADEVDSLQTPPLVANGHVYIGGYDRLYAFSEADGALVWSGDVPVDGIDEHNVSQPYDGITVAEDTVFVSGGDTLTALVGVTPGPAEDTADPVVTPVVRPANAAGWHAGDVTVSWRVTDARPSSGIAVRPEPTVVREEGDPVVVTSGEACDRAGRCATGTVRLRVDGTAPTVTARPERASYGVDEEVVVLCSVSDALSGPAAADCSKRFPGYEAPAGGVQVTGADIAGNTASAVAAVRVQLTYSGLQALGDRFADTPRAEVALSIALRRVQAGIPGDFSRAVSAYQERVRGNTGTALTGSEAAVLLRLSDQLTPTTPAA